MQTRHVRLDVVNLIDKPNWNEQLFKRLKDIFLMPWHVSNGSKRCIELTWNSLPYLVEKHGRCQTVLELKEVEDKKTDTNKEKKSRQNGFHFKHFYCCFLIISSKFISLPCWWRNIFIDRMRSTLQQQTVIPMYSRRFLWVYLTGDERFFLNIVPIMNDVNQEVLQFK